MPRNLNLCFTKIKSLSSSEPSLQQNHPPFSNFATTSLLINSLNLDCAAAASSCYATSDHHSLSDFESESAATTPDFATAFASQRFFFSSPGRSNSIIDSSSVSSLLASTSSSYPENPTKSDTLVAGSIAISTYSPDPFMDFRRSMQEMVEAHDLVNVRSNWDYLHELLMCYLSLNPKSTHKFIVGAFADLVISLMTLPANNGGSRKSQISDGK
ncbi:Transcription repressor OFP16 [Abeliophyllum distichum]|uniref:Transcription repressor n=1 Tax=Abeliophyllum distichum TaxID=126358 RepID=A0ABD1RBT1_9LAMI